MKKNDKKFFKQKNERKSLNKGIIIKNAIIYKFVANIKKLINRQI